MNSRLLIGCVLGLVCLGTLAAVGVQRRELASLRVRHAVSSQRDQVSQPPPQAAPAVTNVSSAPLSEREKLERLHLRAEVTRLRQRQREFNRAREDNAQLLAMLALLNLKTDAGGIKPPRGDVRASEARMAGFASPEATLESFTWAYHRWDTNVLAQASTPEVWNQIVNNPAAREQAARLPGFLIRRKTSLPDGIVELELELSPGTPPEKFRLQFQGGHWKVGN